MKKFALTAAVAAAALGLAACGDADVEVNDAATNDTGAAPRAVARDVPRGGAGCPAFGTKGK